MHGEEYILRAFLFSRFFIYLCTCIGYFIFRSFVKIVLKVALLRFDKHSKYVRLCVSLPLWVPRLDPKTLYLRRVNGNQVSKAHLRAIA